MIMGLYRTYHAHKFVFSFSSIFLFIPCGILLSAFYCTLNTLYRIVCLGNVEDMAEMPARMNRDVAWLTHTCTLGFDVMGKTSLSCSRLKIVRRAVDFE